MINEDKRKWSDLSESEKAEITKTETNEARFWSGQSVDSNGEDVGGEENAKSLAQQDGGKTLEMKLEENNIDTESMSGEEWKEASQEYATGASGDVKCYKGDTSREGNVYDTHEREEIENNSNINSITEVDNINGTEVKATYERNPETGKLESSNGEAFVQTDSAEQFNESSKATAAPSNNQDAAEFNESAKGVANENSSSIESTSTEHSQDSGISR